MISAKKSRKIMGRYYWDKKNTVEDCRSVSISFLRKHDYFCGYRSGQMVWKNCYDEETGSIGIVVNVTDGPYVKFNYTVTDRSSGEKIDNDYKISLTTTACNFGGVRYWFICPLNVNGVHCGRRVGKLYLAPGGGYFGCRHCYNLSYASRNESRLGRLGGLGYLLKAEGQYEELYHKIKRWTYKGQPTRKARKLLALEQRKDQGLDMCKMLLKS